MYILMPIHKEVKTALHSVSHYLQMPEVVLSHDLNQNLDYKYKPITSSHQHLIIDLLDCLIDTICPVNCCIHP